MTVLADNLSTITNANNSISKANVQDEDVDYSPHLLSCIRTPPIPHSDVSVSITKNLGKTFRTLCTKGKGCSVLQAIPRDFGPRLLLPPSCLPP